MSELDKIYSAKILELAASIPKYARLSAPGATATAHSKLCGSTVSAELSMADGRVTDYAQTVKACLLGQATAAAVAHQILGTTPAEFRAVAATMRAMLKAGGAPPSGRWADLAVLQPVKDHKGRHASTLLVFDAVEQAMAAIEAPIVEVPSTLAGATAVA
jgi:NifU-like protein involved in Fe-S cluster formation